MAVIYINFGTGSNTASAPWEENFLSSSEAGSTGVKIADLLDENANPTGIGWENTTTFLTTGNSNQASADTGEFADEVQDYKWSTNTTASGKLIGVTEGSSFTVEMSGHRGASRNTVFTADLESGTYVDSSNSTPNATLSLSGTVSGTELPISIQSGGSGGYLAGLKITISDPAETLSLDQSNATHGDTITGNSSITDGTSAKAVDGSANEMALTNFVNNLDGTYSFDLPDLTPLLSGVIPGTITIELTNGTDTATDTITLDPLPGYTEITATAQAAGLELKDWGYVGTGGLANAVTASDVLWSETKVGLTDNADGTSTIDSGVFAGGLVTRWVLDVDGTMQWNLLSSTYELGGSGAKMVQSLNISNLRIGL